MPNYPKLVYIANWHPAQETKCYETPEHLFKNNIAASF